ncbi:uncharacterized protein [Rutidosis leptorrhynchoides]|uniref:uncharacterized protein n=1 Tax=Rutidosis leptorrhynchoides TaxID=125765 RepID=UPI003A9A360B
MRLSNSTIWYFIFVMLGLYFLSQITNCSTSDPLISLHARRSLKKLEDPNMNVNKVDGNAWRSTKQATSMQKPYDAINNEDAKIVYTIDYQGVKTHPSPTPTKHP